MRRTRRGGCVLSDPHVVLLDGHQSVELGHTVTTRAGNAALALSRGARAKPQPGVDPNEDCALAVTDGQHTFIAVADGHFGADASVAVLSHLATRFAHGLPSEPLTDDDLVALVTDAGAAAWHATRALPYPRRGSRTTLACALLTPEWLQWASIGDSAVYLADGTRLGEPVPVYLGGPLEAAHVASALDRGARPAEPVLLATDGFTDCLPMDEAIRAAVADVGPTPMLAARLIADALKADAFDNLAMATAAPPHLPAS